VRGEEDAEHGAHGDPRPDAVLGGLLVLVHGHPAFGVLGHDRGVIGADLTGRVQRLDGFVVGVRFGFAVVGGHVEEHGCVCHACSLVPATPLHRAPRIHRIGSECPRRRLRKPPVDTVIPARRRRGDA